MSTPEISLIGTYQYGNSLTTKWQVGDITLESGWRWETTSGPTWLGEPIRRVLKIWVLSTDTFNILPEHAHRIEEAIEALRPLAQAHHMAQGDP